MKLVLHTTVAAVADPAVCMVTGLPQIALVWMLNLLRYTIPILNVLSFKLTKLCLKISREPCSADSL